ncbi:Metaxin-2 [Blomia tropicalis]|nr:Metaxin-2 [Blomia tropicalis]
MANMSAIAKQMSTSIGDSDDGDKLDYVTIFQTEDNIQIMLPELGDRLALQAFFHYHNVKFIMDQRNNAEDMSPDGVLPFIRHGDKLISGYGKIVDYIRKKNNIEVQNRLEVEALTILFNEVVNKSELFYTWLDKDIYEQFTKTRYSIGKPWPLNAFLCWLKKWDVSSKIGEAKNIDLDFENLCLELSDRLERFKKFIFGDKPCEVDTLIYGHIKAIYQNHDIYKNLYNIVEKFPNLIAFMKRIDEQIPKE